ncbi:MAG: homoserine dehydrogenase [Oscillospiraceae bacterium]|nr:homoserine dehydrogenase [Oscillospiraceae bacterium]
MKELVKIAVLGFGVVGSGTVEAFDRNSAIIAQNAGHDIQVKYILDIRDFPDSPYNNLLTGDFEKIVSDPDVAVVVETIGGVGPAFDYTKRCLSAGKSVVTSNKELVAAHGYELLEMASANGVNYLFEASVGGGIPIIRPIAQCIAANQINEIYGIVNGTTNYILTEMVKNGAEFSDALADAQRKGYAEADPSADIDGHDACRKICILASLAFGKHIYPEYASHEGIRGISSNDVHFAGELGYKIKLVARARVLGDIPAVYVAPHLISHDNLLAGVDGVMNAVVVRGNIVGDLMFYGAGAGKMPTASAVAADVIDAVKHMKLRKLIGWEEGGEDSVADHMLLESAWYIRTDASREKISHEFGEVIFSGSIGSECAFKTTFMSGRKVQELLERGISALSLFRVLGDH